MTKFTTAQVLEIMTAATIPLPTVEIAQACRNKFGAEPGTYRDGKEVMPALTELERDGKLISARRTSNLPERTVENVHLCSAYALNVRVWATPEVSTAWAQTLAERAALTERAHAVRDAIRDGWTAAGGPERPSRDGYSVYPQVNRDMAGHVRDITLMVDVRQAEWLFRLMSGAREELENAAVSSDLADLEAATSAVLPPITWE